MKFLFAVLAAAVLMSSSPSSAAVCTASTSGTWGPVGSGTATWSCGTPAASDDIVIPDGVSIAVAGDIVQDTTAGVGIWVQTGGTLEANVTATTGRLELILGEDGLRCSAGSTCNFHGLYREANVSSPGLLADPDPDQYFVLGYPDLASGGSTVRVEFPAQKGFHLDSLSAITSGDVLCFFDPDPTDTRVPHDVNYCYEITSTNWTSGTPYLELDVRQGAADHPASPLTRRDVFQDELAIDALAGDRTLSLTSGALTGHGPYAGRFLRFEGTDGEPEQRSYRILASRSVGDTLTLGDVRGLESGHPAGTRVWVDYGWRTGDSFFVMVPVVIGSATPIAIEQSDTWIRMYGSTALRAVLMDAIQRLDLEGATVTGFENVWIRDAGAGPNQVVNLYQLAADVSIERLVITGIDQTLPRSHSIYVRDLTSNDFDITLTDVAIRHHGDDCWSMLDFVGDLTFTRFRCQFATDLAESTNMLQLDTHTGNTSVVDAECVDCLSGSNGSTDILVYPADAGVGFASGVLSWASEGHFGHMSSGEESHQDILMIGGTANSSGQIMPPNTTGCVLRDFTADGTSTTSGTVTNNDDVRDCIFRDVTVDAIAFIGADTAGALENIAIVNPDTIYTDTDSWVLSARLNPGTADDIRLHRITIAWMPGVETGFERGLYLRDSLEAGDVYELHGITVAGLDIDEAGSNGDPYAVYASASQASGADWGGSGPCLYGNDVDLSPGIAANPPASIVQGTPLGFVDEEAGRFDTTPGSVSDVNGCGIDRGVDAPGIHAYRWMHAISGIAPEVMGDDPDGDGVVDDASAGICTGGATAACSDNCSAVFNPSQADADSDSIGDACDSACDDGVDNDGDTMIDFGGDGGCSGTSDPFEEFQETKTITGEAVDGTIDLTISGVLLTIPTTAGQTPAQVAALMAAAVDADPILSLRGVTAVSAGDTFETNGTIDSFVLNEPGSGGYPPPAPTLGPGPRSLVVGLLGLAGAWIVRRRHSGGGSHSEARSRPAGPTPPSARSRRTAREAGR